jgi:hypothetical protein
MQHFVHHFTSRAAKYFFLKGIFFIAAILSTMIAANRLLYRVIDLGHDKI